MQVQGDAAATADEHQQIGVFGPLVPQPPVNYEALQDDDEDRQRLPSSETGTTTTNEADKSLKRQAEPQAQLPNGNAAKRPRLGNASANANANGLENGNGADPATSPMEIDQHQSDNHAYPSPLEGEQAPTPAPRTEGPDHGTQTDKVEDLEAKTVYLRLAPDDSSSVAATPTTADVSHARTSQNPILLHCEWNPKDPSRLAAAGTDALARVWTVSRATGPDQLADHVGPDWPSINLVADGFPPHSKVTAMAWASDGKEIAVATDDSQKARIDLWNLDGKQLHTYTGLEASIVKLRCHPVTRHVLCITMAFGPAGDQKGWTVTVFPSPTSSPVAYEYNIPPDQDVDSNQPDAVWVDGEIFVFSVGTRVIGLKCSGDSITEVKELPTRTDDSLTQIQYAALADGTGYFAAATLKGDIDVSHGNIAICCILCYIPVSPGKRPLLILATRYGIPVVTVKPYLVPTTGRLFLCSGSHHNLVTPRASFYWHPGVKMARLPSGTPARPIRSPGFRGRSTTILLLPCHLPPTGLSSPVPRETRS